VEQEGAASDSISTAHANCPIAPNTPTLSTSILMDMAPSFSWRRDHACVSNWEVGRKAAWPRLACFPLSCAERS
jgi:hypothetical protein